MEPGVGLPPLVMLVLALVALWLPGFRLVSRPRGTSQADRGEATGTNRHPFTERVCGVAPLEDARTTDMGPVLEAAATAENLEPYCVSGMVDTDLADKVPPACDTLDGTVT